MRDLRPHGRPTQAPPMPIRARLLVLARHPLPKVPEIRMIELPPLIFFLTLVVFFAVGAYTGYEYARGATARQRRADKRQIQLLAAEIETLSDQLVSDPVRTGIDTGREYVVGRVQGVLDDIRSER